MTAAPLRLAVWSGPRNISTAMMRAWENRADCAVVDEPLYAHYLAHTGLEHPGREQILVAGERDWRRVADMLLGPVPDGRAIFFQKHMTHHLLPHIDRGWCAALTHVFLIRDPREVLLSYVRSRPQVCAEDIGLIQEHALHRELTALTGSAPPVIDADDFLRAPEAHLRALCAWLGVDFSDAMLHWPAGPRSSDGIWAPYWYEAVLRSTGFAPWRPRALDVPPQHRPIVEACMPAYQALHEQRMRVG